MSDREVAIALGFEPGRDDAPTVLAAGYGHIAKQIMSVARKEGIHIHQDENLAQILAKVPVGYEIPETAYQLVAEILTFLYQTDRTLKEKISR
jgi:flagellar biosynthesis protein